MSSLLALLLAASTVAPTDSLRGDRDIRQTALRHTRDVQRCYVDEGLRRNPALDGVVEVEVTILPTGVVEEAKVASATLAGHGADEVSACIRTIARHWRFDRGPYDTEIVVFPFVLRPLQPAPAVTERSS